MSTRSVADFVAEVQSVPKNLFGHKRAYGKLLAEYQGRRDWDYPDGIKLRKSEIAIPARQALNELAEKIEAGIPWNLNPLDFSKIDKGMAYGAIVGGMSRLVCSMPSLAKGSACTSATPYSGYFALAAIGAFGLKKAYETFVAQPTRKQKLEPPYIDRGVSGIILPSGMTFRGDRKQDLYESKSSYYDAYAVMHDQAGQDLTAVHDIPEYRVMTNASQYSLGTNGKAACAAMSVVSLEAMRKNELSDGKQMKGVLKTGAEVYGHVLGGLAEQLIVEEAVVKGSILSFGVGLGIDLSRFNSTAPGAVGTLTKRLHGAHLSLDEIVKYLPQSKHKLNRVFENFKIEKPLIQYLQRGKERQALSKLADHLQRQVRIGEPVYALLTLGPETYAVKSYNNGEGVMFDFVNSHGEAQLISSKTPSPAAKRTYPYSDVEGFPFVESLIQRRAFASESENQVGLVILREK